jgi:hypothetical protein
MVRAEMRRERFPAAPTHGSGAFSAALRKRTLHTPGGMSSAYVAMSHVGAEIQVQIKSHNLTTDPNQTHVVI